MILRMLVRPKCGEFKIPEELYWLRRSIKQIAIYDYLLSGIKHRWCYVTVRHGPLCSETDDEWHFDGASFRTDIILERNYIWTNHTPPEYKLGSLKFPNDFDPVKHNLFSFAKEQTKYDIIRTAQEKTWLLMKPFCFHRRQGIKRGTKRTFIRISFPDIEVRDKNNTPNPLLSTPAFNRDPVKSFRNTLKEYYEEKRI